MVHAARLPLAFTELLLQMSLLGVALALGRLLDRCHINWFSEAGGALVVGIIVGLVLMLARDVNYNYFNLFKFNVRPFCLTPLCCTRHQTRTSVCMAFYLHQHVPSVV